MRGVYQKSGKGGTWWIRWTCPQGHRHEEKVAERERRRDDRDHDGPPHAEQSDRQTREHARDHEGDALHGTDEPVRPVSAIGCA